MARYHDEPMTLHPAALYTLVDLTDAELGDLERECEAACVDTGNERGTSVRLASQPRFVGQPLRAGQVILSGALGPMAAITAPATVTAHITGLGSVTARFAQE